jgi:hypothetical protein
MSSAIRVYKQATNIKEAIAHLSYLLKIYFDEEHLPSKTAHCFFDIDDTLIFDVSDNKGITNTLVVQLLYLAKAYGMQIHLVTARLENPDVLKWTITQLRKHGINDGLYDSLALAPDKSRESMESISKWKYERRKEFHKGQNIVVFSVGDQWGDGTVLRSDAEIGKKDKKFAADKYPWAITSGHGCKYFLKILADT